MYSKYIQSRSKNIYLNFVYARRIQNFIFENLIWLLCLMAYQPSRVS